MKFILVNAFSINMLDRAGQDISFIPVNLQAVKNLLHNHNVESAVGHPGTAAVLSNLLESDIECNRSNVQLLHNETSLIVAQYIGPRLPEGATTLPEGARIEFWQVYHGG